MSVRSTLRELLAGPDLVMAPGVADALNARLVTREGFKVIYMTGSGTTASRLGMPDIGLLTMTEMVDNAGRIADASGLPVIADADTGYGGPINVQRTTRSYERAGVAGIHIEDQQWPKRCGHLQGKTLIPAAEMAAKVRAATDAREDKDFVVIARTDALSVEGFEQALDRGRLYEEAGADMIFIEALNTPDQLAAVPRSFRVPTLFNMASSGKTPFLSAQEIQKLGFKVVIYPNFMLLAAVTAAQGVLRELKKTGSIAGLANKITTFTELFDLVGMREVQELEQRYGVADNARARY
ncbi:MAG: oxaloacetate decarboxylase [Deltaproteobacteria bacterium]|nr:oxaloacetate decarboxylase [Deltaproteobacteria bacterium]